MTTGRTSSSTWSPRSTARAASDGDTSELGDETDQQLFATLREQVDCVMAGVRTVAIENYKAPGQQAGDARAPGRRRGSRRDRSSRRRRAAASLPLEAPLFQDADARIVVFIRPRRTSARRKRRSTWLRTEDPVQMLAHLRHEYGVRSLLLEGGPHINTPFFAAELVDELFLTLAPQLVGAGDAVPDHRRRPSATPAAAPDRRAAGERAPLPALPRGLSSSAATECTIPRSARLTEDADWRLPAADYAPIGQPVAALLVAESR